MARELKEENKEELTSREAQAAALALSKADIDSEKTRFAKMHAKRDIELAKAKILALEQVTRGYIYDIGNFLTFASLLGFLSRDLNTSWFQEWMHQRCLTLRTRADFYARAAAMFYDTIPANVIGAVIAKFPLQRLTAFFLRKFFDFSFKSSLEQRLAPLTKDCLDLAQIRDIAATIMQAQKRDHKRLQFYAWWCKATQWLLIIHCVSLVLPKEHAQGQSALKNASATFFMTMLDLILMTPSFAIKQYRKRNFADAIKSKQALLAKITQIDDFQHAWVCSNHGSLQLSIFTLQIDSYKRLNPYVICQTIKNTLLENGIPFTAGKATITIDAHRYISGDTAEKLNAQIEASLQRIFSFPELESQMKQLTIALGGSPYELIAMVCKIDNLPLKRFIVPAPKKYQSVLTDNRLKPLFGKDYLLTEDAIVITGYEPYRKNEFKKLLKLLAKVDADAKDVVSKATLPVATACKSPASPSPSPLSEYKIPEKKKKTGKDQSVAGSTLPTEPVAPRIIDWGNGCIYNSDKKDTKIVPFSPGIFLIYQELPLK